MLISQMYAALLLYDQLSGEWSDKSTMQTMGVGTMDTRGRAMVVVGLGFMMDIATLDGAYVRRLYNAIRVQ